MDTTGTPKARAEIPETEQILGRDPKAAGAPEPEIAPQFREFFDRLAEVRDYLADRIRALEKEAQEAQPESINQVGDAGTETFDRDLSLAAVSAYQDQLYEVEEALRRIAEGRFGVCESSGAPIPRSRLEAVPWTRFTAEAEEQLEKEGRAPVRFELPPRFSVNPEAPGERRRAQ